MILFVRNIVLASVVFFGLDPAHAQEQRSAVRAIQFGALMGGGVVGWFGEDSNGSLAGEDRVNKTGLAAGLLAVFNVSRIFSFDGDGFQMRIQPHILYSTRGAGVEFNGEDRGSIDMSYLQAGLLAGAEYRGAGRATPYVVLGPELRFLRSAEFDNGIGEPIDIEDNFKSTDLGLILGLGTMYLLPPWGSVGLELPGGSRARQHRRPGRWRRDPQRRADAAARLSVLNRIPGLASPGMQVIHPRRVEPGGRALRARRAGVRPCARSRAGRCGAGGAAGARPLALPEAERAPGQTYRPGQ